MKVYCKDCKYLFTTMFDNYCSNENCNPFRDTPYAKLPNWGNYEGFNHNNKCKWYESK